MVSRKHLNLLYGEEFFETSEKEKSEENEKNEKYEKITNEQKEEGEKKEKERTISSIRFDFFEFLCHAFLFYEEELEDFSSIFIKFIIESSKLTKYFEIETYFEKRAFNICESEYLKYIINLFENVFFDFNKKSIDDFMSNLFNFISLKKNINKNTFINSVFTIGDAKNLEEKEITINFPFF